MQTKSASLIFISLITFLNFNAVAAPAERTWKPLRKSDYWIDAGLLAGAVLANTQIKQQSGDLGHANFIDDRGRDALRFSSSGQRHDAAMWSNAGLVAAVALPVFGAPALTGLRDNNWNSAARISNINAQAFGLTAILTGATKALVGRERPYVGECRRNPGADPGCADLNEDEGFKSFYSGHSVYAFTGAGLTCLHHTELRLYGDRRDALACGGAIGLATAVAVMRVAADKHYVTDVTTGAMIGLISGYLFPRWLHTSEPVESPADARLKLRWLPLVAEQNTLGLIGVGEF